MPGEAQPKPPNPYAPPASSVDKVGAAYPSANLATRSRRLFAAVIDAGLLVVPIVFAGAPLNFTVPSLALPVELVLYGLIAVGQWTLIARRGQTIGNKWVGIRIVKLDGSAAGLVSGVLVRSWAPFGAVIAAMVVIARLDPEARYIQWAWLLLVVDVCLIFGKERRCVHDLMAGTLVVR